MSISLSDHRKAENEAVFREHNEKIQKRRDRINKLALEDGQSEFLNDDNIMLQYICECSDENCKSRISLMSDAYNEIHENRKCFVVENGHEVLEIETVINKSPKYTIVEKNFKTTEDEPKLHATDVDNS